MGRLNIGSTVRILGDEDKLFLIVGYRQETYCYRGKTMHYYKYCLECTNAPITEQWVSEERVYIDNKRKLTQEEIDELLDDYIKFMSLYELLEQDEFKEMAEEILKELNKLQLKGVDKK